MILYETDSKSKFGWTITLGRKDTGTFGYHVDFYDAPIYTLNLFVFSVSYWGYGQPWLDTFSKLIGKDWRSEK